MERTLKSAAHIGDRRRTAPAAAILRGSILALLVGAALILLLSYLLYRTPDPTAYTRPLSLAIAGAMGAVGGIYAARRCGRGGALTGLAAGALIALVALLVALPLAGGALSARAIPSYLLMLLAGMGGGAIGKRRPRTRRRRR
jgi:putative membrane protein (TIGR04086 family)